MTEIATYWKQLAVIYYGIISEVILDIDMSRVMSCLYECDNIGCAGVSHYRNIETCVLFEKIDGVKPSEEADSYKPSDQTCKSNVFFINLNKKQDYRQI